MWIYSILSYYNNRYYHITIIEICTYDSYDSIIHLVLRINNMKEEVNLNLNLKQKLGKKKKKLQLQLDQMNKKTPQEI